MAIRTKNSMFLPEALQNVLQNLNHAVQSIGQEAGEFFFFVCVFLDVSIFVLNDSWWMLVVLFVYLF